MLEKKFRKNVGIDFNNFRCHVIALNSFGASKASISLQMSSIITDLKGKQLVSLFLSLRTLTWCEKFSVAFRMGSSLKSDCMGRSILRVSTIFSK